MKWIKKNNNGYKLVTNSYINAEVYKEDDRWYPYIGTNSGNDLIGDFSYNSFTEAQAKKLVIDKLKKMSIEILESIQERS